MPIISDTQEKDILPEDKNMAATIAAEEAFAIPNALLASEIFDTASEVLSPVVEDLIGDTVVDILTEFGLDSCVELLLGEALNTITGGVLGTLAGLTYSAYRCGAFWIAPTAKSAAALIFGMLGGLFASTVLRYVWEIGVEGLLFGSDEQQEDRVESIISVSWIGGTLFGAVGAFAGRFSAIQLSNKFMDKYFPSKAVKPKTE